MLKDEMPFTGILSQVLATHSAIQPVSLVLFTPQAPARQDQIFTLQRLTPGTLSLVTLQGNAVTMPPNGRFIFVILMTDPTQIRCARGHDPLNEYMSSGAVDAVEGHTSLSGGLQVLYAGDMLINNGILVSWSNNSGHYQPTPQARRTNLLPHIQLLLPEHLFQPVSFRGSSAASARSMGSRMNDFSSTGSFSSYHGSEGGGGYSS